MSEGDHRAVYSIRAVARMIGVSAATLRNWEERYRLIEPIRSPGGQRLYSREQVKQLRFVQEHLEAGGTPADAHRLLAESLGTGVPERADQQGRSRILVLVAERDRFAAELSEFLLETEGYEVAIALDADDARRAAGTVLPEVAIVELLISGGAGLDLVRSLTHDHLQVIAVSTLDRREESLAAGSSAFLLKPIDPLQLVSAVKDLLGDSALVARGPRIATPTPSR